MDISGTVPDLKYYKFQYYRKIKKYFKWILGILTIVNNDDKINTNKRIGVREIYECERTNFKPKYRRTD